MQHDSETMFERNLNAAANAAEKNTGAKVNAIARDIAHLRRGADLTAVEPQPSQTPSLAHTARANTDTQASLAAQRDDDTAIMHGHSLPPSPSHTHLNIPCVHTPANNTDVQESPSFYSAPVSVAHSTCAPTTVDYNYSRQPSAGLSQSQLSSPDSTTSTRTFIQGLFGCLRPVWNKISWSRPPRSASRPPSPSPSLRNNLDRTPCASTRLRVGSCTGDRERQLLELSLQDFITGLASRPAVAKNGEMDGAKGAADKSESQSDEDCLIRFDELSELKFFAAGAQGAVFRGEYRGRPVAFKKVREAADAENMRFLRALSHPNVVDLLGVVLDREPPDSNVPPCYGIVMAFCEFGSLYNLLHDGRPVLPATCLRWLAEISDGMHYLHSHRIIHRDLKSPNILIAADETVKISDFGASRTWSAASTKLTFAGTAAWVAPELIRNEKSTDRVDVWSYGIVVWEVLTGEVPYRDLDQPAIIYGVGSKRLSLPIPAAFPSGFRMLITTCCNDDPRARPSFLQLSERLLVVGHELANLSVDQFDVAKTKWREEIKRELAARYARNGNDRAATDRRLEHELIAKREAELRHATELKQLYEAKLHRGARLYDDLCRLVTDHEAALTRLRLLQAHYRASTRAGVNNNRRTRAVSTRHKSVTDAGSAPDLVDRLPPRKRSTSYRVGAPPSSQSCVCLSGPQPHAAAPLDANNVQSSFYVTDIDIDERRQLAAALPQPLPDPTTSSSDECNFEPDATSTEGCVMCAVAQLLTRLDTNAHDTNVISKLTQLCAAPHSHRTNLSHAQSAVQLPRRDYVNVHVDSSLNGSVSELRTRSSFNRHSERTHSRPPVLPIRAADPELVDQRVSMVETATPISSVRSSTLSAASMQSVSVDSLSIGASSNTTLTALHASSQNDLNALYTPYYSANANSTITGAAAAHANRFSLSITATPTADVETLASPSAPDANLPTSMSNCSVVQLRRSNRRVIVPDDVPSGAASAMRNLSVSFSPSPTDDTLGSLTTSLNGASFSPNENTHAAPAVDSRCSRYGGDTSACDSRASCLTVSDDEFCKRDSRYSNAHADVEDNADLDGGLSDMDTAADVSDFESASFDEVEVPDGNAATDATDGESDGTRMGRSGTLRTSGRSCTSIVTVVHVPSSGNTDSSSSSQSGLKNTSGRSGLKALSQIAAAANSTRRSKATVPDTLALCDADNESSTSTSAAATSRVPQSTSRDSAIVLGVTPVTPTPMHFAGVEQSAIASTSDGQSAAVASIMCSGAMTLSVIAETRSSTASASNDSRPVSALSDSSSSWSVSGRVGKADRVERELERQISDNLSDKELVVQTLRSRLEHTDHLAAGAVPETYADRTASLQHSRARDNEATVRSFAQRAASTLPARLPLAFSSSNAPLSSCSSEALSSSDELDATQLGTSHSRVLPVPKPETLV